MVTRRTTLRKAFLAPWHPAVNHIWQYAMAYAQHKCDVAIHTGAMPVNHGHLMATPARNNLPEFVAQMHLDISRAINTLLVRHKYDSPRELWDGREPHYMRLMDAPAQATSSMYIHANCVAAGLVARPEHMPGFNFDFDLWKTRYVEVRRPDVFFGDDRPEALLLEVTPPPLLYEAFGGDIDALVDYMKDIEREHLRALRAKHKRGPLGAQRLMRLHPWSEPRTLRETGGKRVPSFRYGARGILGQVLDIEGAREVSAFRGSHREVRIARRDGDLTRAFPHGTYKERIVHGAPVMPVPEAGDAAIAMPGPTLADIEASLAEAYPADESLPLDLVDETRAALADEAQDIGEHAQDEVGDFRLTAEDRHVAVRHRFDRAQPTAGSGVRRVIVKRDRRRGRPAARNRHGADPPA